MKLKFNSAVLTALCFTMSAFAAPARISARLADLGEVHKIYLAQGLASVVQLPYPVTEARVGSPDDIQVQVSKTLPSELTLILKRTGAQPTNLIVRCGTRTLVFDLIPSKKTHQDLVRISGSYGAPDMADMGAVLVDSSLPKGEAGERDSSVEGMVLLDSSDTRSKAQEKEGAK
jgi:hypothetical protein